MRKFIASLLAITMILSLGLTFGESIDELKQQIEEKNQNIAGKEEELSSIRGELEITEQSYYAVEAEIENLKAQIAETEGQIADKEKEIKKTEAKVEEAMKEYNFQAEEFGGRLSTMYLSKDESFWSMIFNAEGFEDLLMRISNYRRIVKMDEETLNELNKKREELEKLEAKLNDEKKELVVLSDALEADKAASEVKSAELAEIKAGLEEKAQEVSAYISAEAAAGAELQAQMDYLVEEARRQAAAAEEARRQAAAEEEARRRAEQEQNQGEEGENSSSDDYYEEPSRDFDYVGGGWSWPTPGYYYVSYYFGNRVHPLFGTSDYHNGIDILGDYGAPVVAARDGLVVHAGWFSGYGNCVIIDHGDGMQSLYAHGTGVSVSVGQYVYAGTTVMPMGSTGISTAVHLHFGIMSGGAWVDPTAYVGG